jgi:hypothetical protein
MLLFRRGLAPSPRRFIGIIKTMLFAGYAVFINIAEEKALCNSIEANKKHIVNINKKIC